jgi:hypothetical protein
VALLQSELARLKTELGYNALTLSALPYAADGITQLFEQVVQPYLQAGELNHSSTAVVAPSSGAPAVVTLTLLTTPTAIVQGDRLIVDQDGFQEAAHVQNVTLTTVTLALSKAHAGTYPVTVEGGEAIVRYYLGQCIAIADRIVRAAGRAGVKKADEVEFFPSMSNQRGAIDDLIHLQRYWRQELASAVGVANLRDGRGASGGGGGTQLLENY